MRVHDHADIDVERISKYHIRCFAPDAGERVQLVHRARHFAAKLFDQRGATGLNVLRFVTEKTGGLHCGFNISQWGYGEIFGAAIFFKQLGGDDIHALVRALRGENCRDEQLQRIGKIQFAVRRRISPLQRVYPDAHCELNFSSPLQLLVATILSAQCTDKRVNLVTTELFEKYCSAKDFADADIVELETDVRSTGFYKNKAKNIKACCAALVEKFGGEVPRTMDELHALAGVGRKTANVVLGNAFGINVGVVVDTHISRLSQRFGLTKETDAVKIEQDLMPLVPQKDWTLFSHGLIWHGRRRCAARKPDCAKCEIQKLCPKIGVKNF